MVMQRRQFLGTGAALTVLAPLRLGLGAEPAAARHVLVILRGGLDGLAAVPPWGDPAYARLRGVLALGRPGSAGGALDLDGYFGLHPALANLHGLYRAGELAVLQAIASPYRERSHFDGQKVLEAGGTSPVTSAGGWLNRALGQLARQAPARRAVALADSLPLVLRGPFDGVTSWTPSRLPETETDTLSRIRQLYLETDPALAATLTAALDARRMAAASGEEGMQRPGQGGAQLVPLARTAAGFLAAEDGPRFAVIDIDGWDTHANQGAAAGQLATRLGRLDAAMAALRESLGPVWRTTSVLVVTEFGRTAAVNGTRGTDHGTAGCAFLAGGAVAGGQVIADWPGLGAGELHEGRDLRATLDLRALFKGVLEAQFGLDPAALSREVFPDSRSIAPLSELLV